MTGHDPAAWAGFAGLVLALLVLDLGVLNRKSHVLSVGEAVLWSAGLVATALLFGGFLLLRAGTQPALEYFTGYLVELSLSVDNLFVFLLIFQYFAVPPALQPRVLKWGIFGAMAMRGAFIALGSLLLARFSWIIYVFGAVLAVTGLRMLLAGGEPRIEPERNPMVRLARRFLPITPAYEGSRFFVRTVTARLATPLLLVLLVMEWSDLVFAIDSIPAIFAVTRDPFIVYSSNIFAVLGLRALFFVLAGTMDKFVYLKPGVALILLFVGAKMVGSAWVHVHTAVSLGVIVGVLLLAIGASMIRARSQAAKPQ
jgi:TerC family integral membrane protein